MDQPETPLFARADTMLGLCHGLGEEFGVNPVWFRIVLALALFWNPIAVITGYLVAGVAFNLFRWLAPFHRTATAAPVTTLAPHGENDDAALAVRNAA